MTNWTDMTARATGYVYTAANWTAEVVNNLTALNETIGNANGSHVNLTDGGILLGNGTGAIKAMAVLAKGSLPVGDGVTDPGVLAVGADNTYLTADSAQALGVKWATPSAVTAVEDIMKYA